MISITFINIKTNVYNNFQYKSLITETSSNINLKLHVGYKLFDYSIYKIF